MSKVIAITLGAYSRIMRFNPAIFMGVKVATYAPNPYSMDQREQVVQSIETAYSMMDTWVVTHGHTLFDQHLVLESTAPYFDLTNCSPATLTSTELTASITYTPGVPLHNRIATLTALFGAIPMYSSIYDVTVLQDEEQQKRLGVELLHGFVYNGSVITATARAYNFIDVDNITEGMVAEDAVPYLNEVTIRVRVLTPAVPKAYWPIALVSYPHGCYPTPTQMACDYVTSDGTLALDKNNIWSVCDYGQPCHCTFPSRKFTLDVIRKGIWGNDFPDAMISLANNFVDESVFVANPLSLYRWRDDQGVGEKWDRVYRYSMWTAAFGISSPGAQKAWKALDRSMPFSQAWSM